jgi:hypothetical protein
MGKGRGLELVRWRGFGGSAGCGGVDNDSCE